MKKVISLCIITLCLSSCEHNVRVVEIQSIKIYTDTSYRYKVIGNDSVVEELTSSVKMKKGDKTTMY